MREKKKKRKEKRNRRISIVTDMEFIQTCGRLSASVLMGIRSTSTGTTLRVIVGGADPPEFLSDHLIKNFQALRMD